MRTRPHLLHLIADQDVFEPIDRYPIDESYYVNVARSIVPIEWNQRRDGIWYHFSPKEAQLPAQGWKLHVSATTHTAQDVLRRCVPLLVASAVPFKHAADRIILSMMNSKVWSRGGSGKFLTIYPCDLEQFKHLALELHERTLDLVGPYILSDRRYPGSKVVHYRYGTIRSQSRLLANGTRQAVLLAPDGSLVTEVRGAIAVVPPWASDPIVSEPSDATAASAPAEILLNDGAFRVTTAMGYTNAGGVYFGREAATERAVIIKEARPYTNWVAHDLDAQKLLEKEYRLLQRVAATGIAPQPLAFFHQWEHAFLAQEYIAGLDLQRLAAQQSLLMRTSWEPADARRFARLLGDVFGSLVDAVATLHEHEVLFGDLSPTNVLWLEDERRVRIIDFEAAAQRGVDERTRIATLGFTARPGQITEFNYDSDWYAVAALIVAFLLPVGEFISLNPSSRDSLVSTLVEAAELPPKLTSLLTAMMDLKPPPASAIKQVLRSLDDGGPRRGARAPRRQAAEAILDRCDRIAIHCLASATPERADRLFPGDFRLQSTNPRSLAYGAAGTLASLQRSGYEIPPPLIAWLLDDPFDYTRYPPGLTVGTAGIAWCLLDMGLIAEGRALLDRTAQHPMLADMPDCGLAHGLAGWGLANLKFYHALGDERHLAQAQSTATRILRMATTTSHQELHWPLGGATSFGLHHGASGIALFLLYLGLATQDSPLTSAAERAFAHDLRAAVATEEGGSSWHYADNVPAIVLPYVAYGSAGVGIAALRFRHLLGRFDLDPVLERIRIDTDRQFAVFPGVYLGLAGLGGFHLDAYAFSGEQRDLDAAHRALSGILMYEMNRGGGLAFPGEYQARISCDYATGSAGVLRFLKQLAEGGFSDYLLDQYYGCQGGVLLKLRVLAALAPALLICCPLTSALAGERAPVAVSDAPLAPLGEVLQRGFPTDVPAYRAFTVYTSKLQAPATTAVAVAATPTQLYVTFRCSFVDALALSNNVNDLRAQSVDFVEVDVDPSGTGKRVYRFLTSPNRLQTQFSSESSRYTPRWSSESAVGNGAFVARLAIPYKAMMLGTASTRTMRINFYRHIAASRDDYVWSYDDRTTDLHGDTRYWPHVSGLRPASSALRADPAADIYFLDTSGAQRNRFNSPLGSTVTRNPRAAGADVTIPLTATTSFVGTLAPDFSNVDVDQTTIAPQRFPFKYREYRPFFARGQQYVAPLPYSGVAQTSADLFYTPVLGFVDSGYKVEGTQGHQSFGLLEAHGAGFSDLAAGYELLSADRSQDLALQAVSANHNGTIDRAAGASYYVQSPKSGLFANAEHLVDRRNGLRPSVSNAELLAAGIHNNVWLSEVGYQEVGPQFSPLDAFLSTNDVKGPFAYASYSRATKTLRQVAVVASADRFRDWSGRAGESDAAFSLNVQTKKLIAFGLTDSVSSIATYVDAYPKYTGRSVLPFNQYGVSAGYGDGTPTFLDVGYTLGPFAVSCGRRPAPALCRKGSAPTGFAPAFLQQPSLSVQRPLGSFYTIGFQYAGSIERSAHGIGLDSQWVRRINLSRAIGKGGAFGIGIRDISGRGGNASPGLNASALLDIRFDNLDHVYFEFGSASAPQTVNRYLLKYVKHFGSGVAN